MENENKTMFAKAASTTQSFGWKSIFSGVFQKHTRVDADNQFAAGLTGHVPSGSRILDAWQKPWLFSRFLMYGIIVWIITAILYKAEVFDNVLAGILLTVPAVVVPVALVIFLWEMNIPRNISIYNLAKMFIVGGIGTSIVMNVVCVILDNSSISEGKFEFWFIVGVTEELTKLILLSLFLRKTEYCWGLNGLAIGAAVGCGFAVFETVGYGFNAVMNTIYQYQSAGATVIEEGGAYNPVILEGLYETMIGRGICSIIAHTAWGAMMGSALALGKGKQKLAPKHFATSTFLIAFFSAILLHAAWDYQDVFMERDVKNYPDIIQNIVNFIYTHGWFLQIIIVTFIFAVPTYAVILWLIRKSVRQTVLYANNAGSAHVEQATPFDHAPVQHAYPNAPMAQPASRSGDALYLECLSGELSGQTYTIQRGCTFTIGRGAQNNVQFADDAKGISRTHCNVSFDGNNALITDLGSTHGTFFANGQKFQPNLKYSFKSGEQFYVASTKNMFRVTIR